MCLACDLDGLWFKETETIASCASAGGRPAVNSYAAGATRGGSQSAGGPRAPKDFRRAETRSR
jgi:hypothetical protein